MISFSMLRWSRDRKILNTRYNSWYCSVDRYTVIDDNLDVRSVITVVVGPLGFTIRFGGKK